VADLSAELAPKSDVEALPQDEQRLVPEDAVALSLSGGGFRAMLFHTGALWRLHETGLLRTIRIFSSVSGGSIANGWLALKWAELAAPTARFESVFVPGIRAMAGTTVDLWAALLGVWTGSIPQRVAAAYDRVLFKGAKLSDLPAWPLFVFDSSNLQTGALWRFTRHYMGDYKVGYVVKPDLPLSVAVGASSAFPPILSPVILHPPLDRYDPKYPTKLTDPRYRARIVLSDGGVYDNLGLEPVIKRCRTLLVSDGGSPFTLQPQPTGFWPVQLVRVLLTEDNQVRGLRKRNLIDRYRLFTALDAAQFPVWTTPDTAALARKGTYWGITTDVTDYPSAPGLPCPPDVTHRLATLSTRLARLDDAEQGRLINWGYAACDYAIRAHVDRTIAPASAWPYPRGLA
jgi:NTE family protein